MTCDPLYSRPLSYSGESGRDLTLEYWDMGGLLNMLVGQSAVWVEWISKNVIVVFI